MDHGGFCFAADGQSRPTNVSGLSSVCPSPLVLFSTINPVEEPLMHKLKQYRDQAMGLSDLLNYASLIREGVLLGKDGSLSAYFYCFGEDVDSVDDSELSVLSAKANSAMKDFGSGWMIHIDVVRSETDAYPMPEAAFPDPVSQKIDDERRQMFQVAGVQYQTLTILSITFLPPIKAISKIQDFVIDDPNAQKTENLFSRFIEQFEQKLDEFTRKLAGVMTVIRLGRYKDIDEAGKVVIYDEILQYLNAIITDQKHPIRLPSNPMYIDSILGYQDLQGGIEPRIGSKWIRVVAIDGFPSEAYPVILRQLSNLGLEYRWNTRFIFMDRHQALSQIQSLRKKWGQKVRGMLDVVLDRAGHLDENAMNMVQEATSSIGALEAGDVHYGFYTSVVVLMDEDLEVLAKKTEDIERVIRDRGFTCRRESLNALEAWFGSLPTHGVQNVRRPVIHTLNLSDLMPLTTIWSGHHQCPSPLMPKNSPPLFQAFTEGRTAYRGNLHVSDVGHNLVIGPSGTGKTTFLNFIQAQIKRYEGVRIFSFDKDYSQLALCAGVGGTHYDIGGPGSSHSIQLCPLSRIGESQGEMIWAVNWIENLCAYQKFKLEPRHKTSIRRALELLKVAESKSLTDFVYTLGDPELKEVLSHYTLEGPLHSLLDGRDDSLHLGSHVVFEMAHIMALGDANALPVLEYIFHRIETSLDGNLTYIPIDEARVAFSHPVFYAKVKEWLKDIRRKNGFVSLFFQAISDGAPDGAFHLLSESCPTKIFLANTSAKVKSGKEGASSYDFYKSLELNDRQIEIISSLIPKQQYYIVQPQGKRIIELGLGQTELRWLSGTSTKEIKKFREISESGDSDWRSIWEGVEA
jgi:type IV secretion/conjugal transfer VirB4 family ATPase